VGPSVKPEHPTRTLQAKIPKTFSIRPIAHLKIRLRVCNSFILWLVGPEETFQNNHSPGTERHHEWPEPFKAHG
jgi:hypothetical protein